MNNKEERIQVRVTNEQKREIKLIAANKGYSNVSKFIVDSVLDNLSNEKEKTGMMTHIIAFSPTADYYVNLQNEVDPDVYRFSSENAKLIPGGRGINVSKIMNAFNKRNITIHYSGGFIGEFIFDSLEKLGIQQRRIKSPNNSRINLKIKDVDGHDLILDQISKSVSEYGKETIQEYVINNVKFNEVVVLAGSIIDTDIKYIEELSKIIHAKKAKLVFNFSGLTVPTLVERCKPWLVAINKIDRKGKLSRKEALEMLDTLILKGAKEVAIIVDTNFIYFGNKNERYFVETNTYENQSPIGLADALIAGFISNIDEQSNERYLWSSASVSARSLNQYDSSYEEIINLKQDVKIIKL